jgi:SpoVK/Ycf46/Vps4 family AAA+-type ATPase
LLTGSPMSGKTYLSHHCCRYAATLNPAIKVLDVSCTSLIHKEVGGSERAVRRLFDCARKAAPCIVIMDAIENVAAVRGHDTTTEGTLDRILSTLLVELDGVDDIGSRVDGGIAVIGTTHDSSLVDTALLRPGRLGKVLQLSRDW